MKLEKYRTLLSLAALAAVAVPLSAKEEPEAKPRTLITNVLVAIMSGSRSPAPLSLARFLAWLLACLFTCDIKDKRRRGGRSRPGRVPDSCRSLSAPDQRTRTELELNETNERRHGVPGNVARRISRRARRRDPPPYLLKELAGWLCIY